MEKQPNNTSDEQVYNAPKEAIESKFMQLMDMGFPHPEMFKFIAMSYKTCIHRMTGVHISMGGVVHLHIGPQNEKTALMMDPSMEALDIVGLNPHATMQLIKDYCDSKIRKDGMKMFVGDILFRMGPQNKRTHYIK